LELIDDIKERRNEHGYQLERGMLAN